MKKLIFVLCMAGPLLMAEETRNGGNFTAMEFNLIGREQLEVLKIDKVRGTILNDAQLKRYEEALKLDVVLRPGPLYDRRGEIAHAKLEIDKNNKPFRYVLDDKKWTFIRRKYAPHQMVFHELLRYILWNTNDYSKENSYEISSKIYQGKSLLYMRHQYFPEGLNTVHAVPDVSEAKVKTQKCERATEFGVVESMEITYYVDRALGVVDIKSLRVVWDDDVLSRNAWKEKVGVYEKSTDLKRSKDKVNLFKMSEFGPANIEFNAKDWANIEITLHHDESYKPVAAFVHYSDGGGKVLNGFHRCKKFPSYFGR